MYQDHGEEIELQDFSGPINVELDGMPVVDLIQLCLSDNMLTSNSLGIITQLSRDTQKTLLNNLNLSDRVKTPEFFVTLLSAVRDRQHFLQFFSKKYFTEQRHYSLLWPEGKADTRMTLNKYLQLITIDQVKVDLIDRLSALGYFSEEFFRQERSMSAPDLEHELRNWPQARRSLLVAMPGNFFRYIDAIEYHHLFPAKFIFNYMNPLQREQLVEARKNYKTLYFSCDFRLKADFLRAQKILSDYAPDGLYGAIYRLTRTPDHQRVVKKVLAQAKQGEITTAIDLVKEILQELPVIPKQNALYQALLYIAETNYVSLDDMIQTELAIRAGRNPVALRVV